MANIPLDLEQELTEEISASIERGKAIRRRGIVWTVLGLVALLITLNALDISDHMVVAVTVAAASLYLIWAIYSVSASLNAQFDSLTKVVAYYAESNGTTKTVNQSETLTD